MKAIRIECSTYEWWGDRWSSGEPYSIDTAVVHDCNGLPNAPVTIYVVTTDPLEAAQLLRLAAAKLESEHALLAPLNEPGNSPCNPALWDGFDEVPF